jgi:hypothetical protein
MEQTAMHLDFKFVSEDADSEWRKLTDKVSSQKDLVLSSTIRLKNERAIVESFNELKTTGTPRPKKSDNKLCPAQPSCIINTKSISNPRLYQTKLSGYTVTLA